MFPRSLRYRLLLALAAVLALIGAFAGWRHLARPDIDRTRVYRIGYGSDKPLHFKNAEGKPDGIAVDLVNAAAQRSGIKLEWVEAEGNEFPQDGLDLWVLMTVLPERTSRMHFSDAYLQTHSCLLVRGDSPYREVADLAHARICYNRHVVVLNALNELLPQAEKIWAPSAAAAIAALEAGTADAAMVDEYLVISEAMRGANRANIRIMPTRTAKRLMAVASIFATAGVADEIRRSMQVMADNGELRPLIDHWTYYSNPLTEAIDEFAASRRRTSRLIAGIVVLSLLLVAMVALAVRSRQQARRLHEAEGLLRGVADRVPGLVCQIRRDERGSYSLPFASEAIRRLYRISPESVQKDAAGFFAPVHPDDRDAFAASLRQSAEQLTLWSCNYRVQFSDGVERWLSASAVPHREPGGEVLWHGFIADITERRAAEASAQAFDRQLQETQKLESLGVLAGGIAHDFNNLLTGILGNANLASVEAPADSPIQAHLEPIRVGSLRAAELCKQLLAYSGKGRFVVGKIDLHQLLDETTELLRHAISKQCELRFDRAAQLPPVEGDASQLRQVVMNLVINASEAIGSRPGTITIRTRLVPGPNGGPGVCLEVSDNGSGMTPETKARIFEPFFTTKFTGRGLGLAAVHGIVRGHRGDLEVESAAGQGTTFRIRFPAAEGRADPIRPPPVPTDDWRGEGCVLVIDDEGTVRKVCATLLRRYGFTVTLAEDGRKGIAAFAAEPDRFSLVLLDLTMPEPDGRQVLAELHRLRPGVRVVLMSGYNEEEVVAEFVDTPLAGFLQKPFEMESFRRVVRQAVDQPPSATPTGTG